jgi:hypothetical protein
MAKIHTHYDNLKVARMAPPEVIRGAYKALSQKYHPDKNPGDDKAARIMAIVNTAYGILADPQRRKEHDEWIAAEEWEIAWLESATDDGAKGGAAGFAAPGHGAPVSAPRRTLWRHPGLWLALLSAFAIGGAVGALALSALPDVRMAAAPLLPAVPASASVPAAAAPDEVAASRAVAARAPTLQTLAVTELLVPARGADCSTELRSAQAPNGAPWPDSSGYIDGYAVANQGMQMRVEVDNGANDAPVFVRLIDLERGASVRHAYVLAHETLTIDKLVAGRYEVRYQNVDPGGVRGNCPQAAKAPVAAP